jgi:hypothetical protein
MPRHSNVPAGLPGGRLQAAHPLRAAAGLTSVQGTAIYIGAVLGAGVIALAALAASTAGPAPLLAWLALIRSSARSDRRLLGRPDGRRCSSALRCPAAGRGEAVSAVGARHCSLRLGTHRLKRPRRSWRDPLRAVTSISIAQLAGTAPAYSQCSAFATTPSIAPPISSIQIRVSRFARCTSSRRPPIFSCTPANSLWVSSRNAPI